ncbi:MAG: hypothetical protein ACI9RV_002487, partial [Glaciecola sp.]
SKLTSKNHEMNIMTGKKARNSTDAKVSIQSGSPSAWGIMLKTCTTTHPITAYEAKIGKTFRRCSSCKKSLTIILMFFS